jgi:hypothetical protein
VAAPITALVDTQTSEFLDTGGIEDARFVRKPLSRAPDPTREKWDAVLEFRPKTPAELAADVAAHGVTAQLTAQSQIDAWPLMTKALVLALIDQLNVIRAALPVPLGPISAAQALAAIRAKAGTL